jgi:putative SOS response-associated peptidase YedK
VRWGLIPYWAKDPGIASHMINARAETAASKTAFSEPLRKRRSLIPADGFYEWQRRNGSKQPFCFTMAHDRLFAFAGLWDRWASPDGQYIETCSILTTSPNAILADVHDRMPVILAPDAYDLWLDPDFSNLGGICDLMKPYDAREMRRFAVSTTVNTVTNEDEDVCEPLGLSAAARQMELGL